MAQVNPIFVLPFRISDGATVTASSESGENVATNIQDQRPSRVWRSTADTGQWLKWDFGAATAVNALVIGPHNLSPTATIDLDVSTDNSNWTDIYSGTADARSPEFAYGTGLYGENYYGGYIDTSQVQSYKPIFYMNITKGFAYRYWRVRIEDGDNPDGYIEIGRAALDRGIDASNPYFWGYQESFTDPSPIGDTAGGFRYASERAKRRVWRDLQFVCSQQTWKTFYLPLIEQVGNTRFFYALLDESKADSRPSTSVMDRAYCRIVAASEPTWASNHVGRFKMSIEQAL